MDTCAWTLSPKGPIVHSGPCGPCHLNILLPLKSPTVACLLRTDLVFIIHVQQEPCLPCLLESPALLLPGPPENQDRHLRIWRTVPAALRPDHLQAHGSGAWLRGMCTLSTSTVGVPYSISGTYICNNRDTGSISNSTILLFYDFKGSILNFLNPSILFCCFLRREP